MAIRSNEETEYALLTTNLFDPWTGQDLGVVASTNTLKSIKSFDQSIDGMSDLTVPTAQKYSISNRLDVMGQITRYKKAYPFGVYHESSFRGPIKLSQFRSYEPKFDSVIELVHQESITRFYDKVKDSNLNLAQDLAEINETTQLVRSILRFIRNSKAEAAKLVARFGNKPSQALSDAWLAYMFGVRPTLSTIHDLSLFEARKLNGKKRILSKTSDTGEYEYGEKDDKWGYLSVEHSYALTRGASLRIPDNDTINRLTSLDPLVIAYELLPWSFVFDWIVDIGSYLENLESERRYKSFLTDNYMTTSYKRSATTTYSYDGTNGLTTKGDIIVGEGKIEKTSVERVLLLAPPSASYPRLELPKFGYSRIGTSVALFIQALPNVIKNVRR